MKFSAKLLDIHNRGVLLNRDDARSMGVLDGDRVQVINQKNGEAVMALVDTTSSLIEKGHIGLYRPTHQKVDVKEGEDIEVRETMPPNSVSLIKKKMNGERLNKEEIYEIVFDIVEENLSPTELTAFVTAAYIHELDMNEIEHLTRSMVDTGDTLKFSTHPIVDKHSIGGVPGNKISLLIVPILAASGLKIPKTSSRAITGAGGTADLMEVLAPVEFSATEVQLMTEKVGGTIVWGGATNIAPADDRIILVEYPFKIDARGQMLASVMAKKMAVGADLLVIDIPVGENTKVRDISEGRKLAREFVELGERLGIEVQCALTYGESPVGHTIGPALEVQEALSVLEGVKEPNSLILKSIHIAGIALEMAGKAARGKGYELAQDIIVKGDALQKLKEIIEVQGGDPTVKSEDIVPGDHSFEVRAPDSGYVVGLNNRALITLARIAGAPHEKGAGIYLHAKKGTRVKKGDPIFTIYAERGWRLQKAIEEGRRLMPVVVEGMLLDRVPQEHWA
jgi:AMP phosphorylase